MVQGAMYPVGAHITNCGCEAGRECTLNAKVPLHHVCPTWIIVDVFKAFGGRIGESYDAPRRE
jgi:hypothetical protein